MQGVMLISRARRFAKHRLFDNGVFRRTREEKLSEFRRKQREQRRNSERRKVSDTSLKLIKAMIRQSSLEVWMCCLENVFSL